MCFEVQRYIELDLTAQLNESVEENFEEVTSNIIILFADTDHAEMIIQNVPIFSMSGKVCILSEQASLASHLPTGCLSVRLRQNALSALRDAMMIIRNGIGMLTDYDIDPPKQCSGNMVNSEWTNTLGNKLYRQLITNTVFDDTPIQFNDKGDRIKTDYDITNSIDGKLQVIGHMSGTQQRIEINETKIVWLGGTRTKPLEITLPKHLRAVTVSDQPFVYTVPTVDSARCYQMQSFIVDGINVETRRSVRFRKFHEKDHGSHVLNDSTTEMFCCAGYAIELLANLALPEVNGSVDTGFTFALHLNDSYGAVLLGENGYVLSGMVGELDIDEADLAVGALTINPEREQYIDFSEPWLYHGIKILEKW
ncbi:unnamed protein product, partial [Anisakis simplex]|uniref:Glutamate receptor ionotropic, NMDA 1 (inferred by orthology to a human protein) n=1 Tax=Anisakis simplex TaxID=6269 RepID=A0A0M3KEH0_ANISI